MRNIFIGFLIDKGKNWSQMKWVFKFSLEQMKTKLISENIKNEKFIQCSKFSNWQSFFQITKPLFCQQSIFNFMKSVHRYFFLFTFVYLWSQRYRYIQWALTPVGHVPIRNNTTLTKRKEVNSKVLKCYVVRQSFSPL